MSNATITSDKLREEALRGNWDFIDTNLGPAHLTQEEVIRALTEDLVSEDQNLRDYGATVLIRSNEELSVEALGRMNRLMATDPSDIVQFRLAMALFKRGNRTEEVLTLMGRARLDSEVGEEAEEIYTTSFYTQNFL